MGVATDPLFSIVTYIWVKKIIENGFWDAKKWRHMSLQREVWHIIRRSSYGILDIKKKTYTNYIAHNKIYNII